MYLCFCVRISLFPSLLLSFFFHSKFETLCVANCKQNSRKNSKVIWRVAVLCCIVVWCDAWRVDFVEIWTHFIATIFLVRFLDDVVVVVIIWSKQFSALRSCCSLFFICFSKNFTSRPFKQFDLTYSPVVPKFITSSLLSPLPFPRVPSLLLPLSLASGSKTWISNWLWCLPTEKWVHSKLNNKLEKVKQNRTKYLF